MAPRHGQGLDFTPIITHYLVLATFVLAAIGWLVAFIGQAAFEASIRKSTVVGGIDLGSLAGVGTSPIAGTLWFGIFLHLAVILGVLYTLATDNIALNRLQISVFSGISIIYAVEGVNLGLFTKSPSANAMGAGYLLLCFVFIPWTLFFTAEEGSLTLDMFNRLGTGGLTGPGRRRTIVGGQGVSSSRSQTNMNANGGGIGMGGIGGGGIGGGGIGGGGGSMMGGGGGPVGGYADYGGSPNAPTTHMGYGGSGIGGGPGGGLGGPMSGGVPSIKGEDMARSQHSLSNKPGDAQSMTSMGNRSNAGGPPMTAQTGMTGITEASAPLMTGSSGEPTGSEQPYSYRAKALYNYTASADDPNELSFNKGEILDIVDNSGKWWQAKKSDGTTGIAPSNYLLII